MTFEEELNHVMLITGLNRDTILSEVKGYIAYFGGLVSESGALEIVRKDHVEEEKKQEEDVKRMPTKAKVTAVYPFSFTDKKTNEKKPAAKLFMTLDSGETIKTVVWGECDCKPDQWVEFDSRSEKPSDNPKYPESTWTLKGLRSITAPGAPLSQEIPGVETLKETKPPAPKAPQTNLWKVEPERLEELIREEENPVIRGHLENIIMNKAVIKSNEALFSQLNAAKVELAALTEMIKQWIKVMTTAPGGSEVHKP